MSASENVRIVIDNGSAFCKVGFAGEDVPHSVFPTVIGKPDGSTYSFIGDDAHKSALGVSSPITHGIIDDWDGMEKIWHHAFYDKMKVAPEEHGVLLTESPMNTKDRREKMVELMFEKFNVPSAYLAINAVLALYANGITTGFVLDCGGGVIQTVPIYEGYALLNSVKRFNFDGTAITENLKQLLNGYSFLTPGERDIVINIKEKLGYVALDFDEEMKKLANDPTLCKSYTLPDGKVIEVGNRAFRCTEILFQPSLAGRKFSSLSRLAYNSIMHTDVSIRKDLFANFVLSGGTSLFPGFAARIEKELTKLTSPDFKIKIIAPEHRQYSTWVGGSVLGGLHTYREMWISKALYDEKGPQIVHRNCPL